MDQATGVRLVLGQDRHGIPAPDDEVARHALAPGPIGAWPTGPDARLACGDHLVPRTRGPVDPHGQLRPQADRPRPAQRLEGPKQLQARKPPIGDQMRPSVHLPDRPDPPEQPQHRRRERPLRPGIGQHLPAHRQHPAMPHHADRDDLPTTAAHGIQRQVRHRIAHQRQRGPNQPRRQVGRREPRPHQDAPHASIALPRMDTRPAHQRPRHTGRPQALSDQQRRHHLRDTRHTGRVRNGSHRLEPRVDGRVQFHRREHREPPTRTFCLLLDILTGPMLSRSVYPLPPEHPFLPTPMGSGGGGSATEQKRVQGPSDG